MNLELAGAVDRASPLPYYAQLKQLLLLSVDDQQVQPGTLLPGDKELADHFGLSRSVVRQALAELEAEGMIVRRRGKGTYLARAKVSEGLVGWSGGLIDDAQRRGTRVRSQVIRSEVSAADSRIAALLEIADLTPVVLLERVRYLDEEPWVHTTTWLPAARVPGLEAEDFRDQSLYGLLRSRYRLRFGRVKRSIEAGVAGEVTGKRLGIGVGDPVLRLSSVLRDDEGIPLETFVAFHRGDRSRFDVELDSNGTVSTPLVLHTSR